MRTSKSLSVQPRRIYHPELMSCPSCGALLVGCPDLKWDKIVQTLDQVMSIASRPGHCPNPDCAGHTLRLLSAQGQGHDHFLNLYTIHRSYIELDSVNVRNERPMT